VQEAWLAPVIEGACHVFNYQATVIRLKKLEILNKSLDYLFCVGDD
jgi:hypothetical protein